jgi:hypothetical protein
MIIDLQSMYTQTCANKTYASCAAQNSACLDVVDTCTFFTNMTHASSFSAQRPPSPIHMIRTHTHIHTRARTHTHTYTQTHKYMYLHTHAYPSITYVCMIHSSNERVLQSVAAVLPPHSENRLMHDYGDGSYEDDGPFVPQHLVKSTQGKLSQRAQADAKGWKDTIDRYIMYMYHTCIYIHI